MRVLVTGATGFVGRHLVKKLNDLNYEVVGTSRYEQNPHFSEYSIIPLNLDNEDDILKVLNDIKPQYVFHLAGQSSVKNSWDYKIETYQANIITSVNLLEAIRKSGILMKVITIGSSEEYGVVSSPDEPIIEETPLKPISPYGVSKATLSMLAQQYYKVYDLQVIHARPFNHIGPGQRLGFVTSDFSKQISDIEKGLCPPIIKVGNLSAKRDFLDVRDIVNAYINLAVSGRNGETYNVCSGTPVQIEMILNKLVELANVEVSIDQDSSLIRPIDIPIYIGSNQKITLDTTWSPQITLLETLKDILNHFRNN